MSRGNRRWRQGDGRRNIVDMVNEDGDLNLDERVTTTRWSEASIKGVNQCINAFFETTNSNDEVFEYEVSDKGFIRNVGSMFMQNISITRSISYIFIMNLTRQFECRSSFIFQIIHQQLRSKLFALNHHFYANWYRCFDRIGS